MVVGDVADHGSKLMMIASREMNVTFNEYIHGRLPVLRVRSHITFLRHLRQGGEKVHDCENTLK